MRKAIQNVRQAMRMLIEIDKAKQSMFDDPMTDAMGAPTDDFCEQWDRQQRHIACYILKHSPRGSRRYCFAEGYVEQYMP